MPTKGTLSLREKWLVNRFLNGEWLFEYQRNEAVAILRSIL